MIDLISLENILLLKIFHQNTRRNDRKPKRDMSFRAKREIFLTQNSIYKSFLLYFFCLFLTQCRHSLKEADRELSLQENILPHQPLTKAGDTLEHTLANGMKVILQEQHGAKVVALQVWVNVGSADETDNEAGIAHVHEHMLFKGTKKKKSWRNRKRY